MDSSRYGTISKTINKKAAKLQAKAKALESEIKSLTVKMKTELDKKKKAAMMSKLAGLICEKRQNSGGAIALSAVAKILHMLSHVAEALILPVKLFVKGFFKSINHLFKHGIKSFLLVLEQYLYKGLAYATHEFKDLLKSLISVIPVLPDSSRSAPEEGFFHRGAPNLVSAYVS